MVPVAKSLPTYHFGIIFWGGLWPLREALKKKNSKKSDIVTIRSGTYLPYLNSDIKFSDICSKTLYLPTPRK